MFTFGHLFVALQNYSFIKVPSFHNSTYEVTEAVAMTTSNFTQLLHETTFAIYMTMAHLKYLICIQNRLLHIIL